MTTELAIPQLAYDKADEIAGRYPSDREAAAHIAAEVIAEVAPLILAAELDRLIEVMDGKAKEAGIGGSIYANGRRDGLEVAGTELYRRAAELRGEAQ
jgi:hypothetical protein